MRHLSAVLPLALLLPALAAGVACKRGSSGPVREAGVWKIPDLKAAVAFYAVDASLPEERLRREAGEAADALVAEFPNTSVFLLFDDRLAREAASEASFERAMRQSGGLLGVDLLMRGDPPGGGLLVIAEGERQWHFLPPPPPG